jgi:hypothetical protein
VQEKQDIERGKRDMTPKASLVQCRLHLNDNTLTYVPVPFWLHLADESHNPKKHKSQTQKLQLCDRFQEMRVDSLSLYAKLKSPSKENATL